MQRIVIDPVTRIEGHLKVEVMVEGGVVKEARTSGTLFRGLEMILQGRHPLDAPQIVQRICGVCPTVHCLASSLALDEAFGIAGQIPDNGRILRNLILGANLIQSHVLHFYHLALLDYLDLTAVADYEGTDPDLRGLRRFLAEGELGPFLPRPEGDYRLTKEENRTLALHYVRALDIRRLAHEMSSIFGGKMPHNVGIIPGGVTAGPTVGAMTNFLWKLNDIRQFLADAYVPDVLTVARRYGDHLEQGKGPGRYLSYGYFAQGPMVGAPAERRHLFPSGRLSGKGKVADVDLSAITESVAHSWYAQGTDGSPADATTAPEPKKPGAYTWLKAPRYEGESYEVGPLARLQVAYARGVEPVRTVTDAVLAELAVGREKLESTMGRLIARALECQMAAEAMAQWVLMLRPGEPHTVPFSIPQEAKGVGLTDGPRGALGHWLRIQGGRIAGYQAVVPSTWNVGPRDASDAPGPMEQAITGLRVKSTEQPVEVLRVVRSFDPCLACAVHLVTVSGRDLGMFRVL
jgi:hydrogenase large subunit